MQINPRRKAVLISLALYLLVGVAFAVIEVNEFRYERPIRAICGRVTGFNQVVPGFWVDVYDKSRVPVDHPSQAFDIEEHAKVASVEPNEKGEFTIKPLPKGLYDVRFGNRGGGGYNEVALLVNVDPKGAKDRLCVDVGLESSSHTSSVRKCGSRSVNRH